MNDAVEFVIVEEQLRAGVRHVHRYLWQPIPNNELEGEVAIENELLNAKVNNNVEDESEDEDLENEREDMRCSNDIQSERENMRRADLEDESEGEVEDVD